MYEKLQKLRDRLDQQRPLMQLAEASHHPIKGAFVTAHEHFTAATVEVLHLGCNIHHPESKDTPDTTDD